MKYILFMLMLFNISYGQLVKIELDEPARSVVMYNGEFLASTDVFNDYVDITFFDNRQNAKVTFAVSMNEYKQLGDLLTSYTMQDKDFFQMNVKRGVLSIRYIEKYGYKQAYINLRTGEAFYHFPLLNRMQFILLFK